MRKFVLSALVAFTSTLHYSQKTDIQWKGYTVIDYGTAQYTYPTFGNDGFSAQGNNVFISQKGKSYGRRLKFSNLVWEKINPKELLDLDINTLPEGEHSAINYCTDDSDHQEYYNALISTFKRNDDTVYRLASFELMNDDNATRRSSSIVARGSTENPLKSGTFYKIKVDKSGIFKIDKKFLTDNGINPANINPKNFRIYGNGGLMLSENNKDDQYNSLQETAIQLVGEDDSVWNDGDYALFYAQGTSGFGLYNSSVLEGERYNLTDNRSDRSLHTINLYDDYAYYFINFDLGEGKRVGDDATTATSYNITRYDDYQFIDEEKYNILKLGRLWVGDAFQNSLPISFKTRTPIQNSDIIYYRTSVAGYKSSGNSLTQSINGQNEKSYTFPISGRDYVKYSNYSGTMSGLSGNEITISITPNLTTNPSGTFYFDYAEILYKQDLSFNDSQMNFRDYSIDDKISGQYGFSMSNASTVEQIWEVSDPTNAKRKVNQSSGSNFNFGYNAGTGFNNEFVAFKNTAAYTPSFVGRIDNQDLSGLSNIDYLIITRRDMTSEAQRIANYHEANNNFKTAIVDVDLIYNEFSSGGKDITAIRNFITKLNNENGGLKYVLIIGDTSYDYKNKTSGNDNVVPSYISENSTDYSNSFVSDDYFVMTKPQTSNSVALNIPDIPTGRLIASNVSEAKILVDKILAYYNALPNQSTPFGEWRMNLDFVVDDDGQQASEGGKPFHENINSDLVANFETGTERKEYNVSKLYFDAYTPESSAGGQRYPQVNQAIGSAFGNSLYLFYFGHGGINGWAQERVLTIDEISKLANYNSVYSRFPLVSTITCEFTLWDEPSTFSAGEQMMKLSAGGPATMITSSREISITYGRRFATEFTKQIFALENNDFHRLGDAHLKAKQNYGGNLNHMQVNFLGDPAMKLSRPKPQLTIDNIEPSDKIKALDFVTITGRVLKEDGSTDNTFNGKVAVNIFDKPLTKETKGNDGQNKMSYQEEGSAIVKSSASVVNGVYTIQFYVPKDINYDDGDGRILMYADNFKTAKSQAFDVFANQSYKIGGINENGIDDNEAPKATLYMNNTNFADGGITNQNPTFLACVTDNTGINSAGSGIGHDITVYLDGEIINTIILNDFYQSGEGNGCQNSSLKDYQKGFVTYPFRNLSTGTHQLTFKVWDINNNSTTSSLSFIVKDESEQKLTLNRLLNWPNPFTDKTYIQFEHNCDDILDVNVQIYTITGKLVRTLTTQISAEPFMEGFRTPRQAIEWDGRDDFGDAVGKGTYIYKVLARSINQDKCKSSATAVEKLVILK